MKHPIITSLGLAILAGIHPLHATLVYAVPSDGTISHDTDNGDPGDTPMQIRDVLASSVGQGVEMPNFNADFSTDKTFQILFTAPSGKQFDVNPATWTGGTSYFSLNFGARNEGTVEVDFSTTAFEWLGVSGTAPTVTYVDYATHAYSVPGGAYGLC